MKKEMSDYLKADAHLMRQGFRKISNVMGRELGWDTAALYEHLRSLGDFYGDEHVEHNGETWFFRPSAALETFIGCKRRGLDRMLTRLVDEGLIECTKRSTAKRTHVSHYRIIPAGLVSFVGIHVQNAHPKRDTCTKRTRVNVQNVHLPSVSPLPKRDILLIPDAPQSGAAEVREAFEAYQKIMSNRLGLSDNRKRALKKWLKTDGNDLEKLKALALGLSRSTFHVEGRFTDISHLLRDSNEDRFMALSRGAEEQEAKEQNAARAKALAEMQGGAS